MDVGPAVDAVWRAESARIVAALVRMVGDVGTAEELAQDALLAALQQWPDAGVPDNPGAWLTAVAKRRAVDHLRRGERLDRGHDHLAHELATRPDPADGDADEEVGDDVLRLMFVSCHPAVAAESRVALTLRLIGGLRTDEIARAFLVPDATVAQRVVRAKRTIAELGVPFEVPDGAERAARLASVLEVVYLVFNEGYTATAGADWIRHDLCREALRLGDLLARLAPADAEVHGLVALMALQASRAAARTGPTGEPVPLHEQDRSRWDGDLVRRGAAALLRARRAGGPLGPYVLQAAIAVCHAQARSAEDTDWAQIAALYDVLVRILPGPVVRLNRAVAHAMAHGPAAGLVLADGLLAEPALAGYHRLPAVRGDLLVRLGRHGEACREFTRAAELTRNIPERTVLLRRAAECVPAEPRPGGGVSLGVAAREFLAERTPATARSYAQTLDRLRRDLGDDAVLARVDAERVANVVTAAWGDAAAATWNRHRGAVRSFVAWAGAGELADGLERRPEPRRRTRPLAPDLLDALWRRPDLAPRERGLWRLLHESAAPVGVVLGLDVEDLDEAAMRGRAGSRWVRWGVGAAALLPGLVAGRRRGPLFLSHRPPGPGRADAPGDVCPETGRRRLSYERAEYLFKQATGHTLHQLRIAGPAPGRTPRAGSGP